MNAITMRFSVAFAGPPSVRSQIVSKSLKIQMVIRIQQTIEIIFSCGSADFVGRKKKYLENLPLSTRHESHRIQLGGRPPGIYGYFI